MRIYFLLLLLVAVGHVTLDSSQLAYAQPPENGEVEHGDDPVDPDDPMADVVPLLEEPEDLDQEAFVDDVVPLEEEIEQLVELEEEPDNDVELEEELLEFHMGDGAPIDNQYVAPIPEENVYEDAADQPNVALDDGLPPWGGDPRVLIDQPDGDNAAGDLAPNADVIANNQYVDLELIPNPYVDLQLLPAPYGQLQLLPPGAPDNIINDAPAAAGPYAIPDPAIPAERPAQRQTMIIKTIVQIYPEGQGEAAGGEANNNDPPGFFKRFFSRVAGGPRNSPKNNVADAGTGISVEVSVQVDFQNAEPNAPAWNGNQNLSPQVFVNVGRGFVGARK